ncbi:DUF6677 family protein [Shewanella halotolerans]|uniref:DUF6677 family protein n=1 Tax=Shewanella halotolerans TaxID=2864204 RepID=UPI001C6589EC|nr:DUF6677 family protein [Shewanella halotolerans]QYJ90473.1 hypothetical protein K0H81_02400 [Shewanella halotolerans]
MNKAIIATLLSAFVCPGSGHFYLKRYNAGTLISCISLSGIAYLLYQAVNRAVTVSDQILSGELPLDYGAIYAAISQAPQGGEAFWLEAATWAFILGWLIGIIDAYRQGRKLMRLEARQSQDHAEANH